MQTITIQNPSLTSSLGTTVTTILPAPASAAIVSAITFCNKSAGTVTVQCSVYNGSTDTYLVYNAPIAVGDTLVLGGGNLKVQLGSSTSLRALCNTASAVDVTVSYSTFT
jgi:hypothetical protein